MSTDALVRPVARKSVDSRMRIPSAGSQVAAHLGVALVVVVFLLPFTWLVLTSFKPTTDVFRYAYPVSWATFIPPQPTLANYVSIFTQWTFQRDLLNSFIAATGQAVGACVLSTMAGFVFGQLQFRGRDVLFGVALLTSFIPFDVLLVPLYVVVHALGMVSTYPALFLPFVFSPFGIFLMRQAFADIPRELREAATVDGASLIHFFRSVAVPNVIPALVTLALVQVLWSWNSYVWPLTIMQDPTRQVVQVSVAKFRGVANGSSTPLYGELFAAASAATLPVVVIFCVLQRYYIRGVILSGMR